VTTIGVPAEVKDGERRIALDPIAVTDVVRAGFSVAVQAGAGVGAGFSDGDYKDAGADIVPDAADAWAQELVVKVKEPQPSEYAHFREDLTLFTFLHLAAEPELTRALVASGVRAYAYETLGTGRQLPLLAPMSEIAGRVAPIVGAYHLSSHQGGAGTLLGGAAGVPPAKVVVIGLGHVGTMAARGAKGLDAYVMGVDVDLDRLRTAVMEGVVDGSLASSEAGVGEAVADADLVVGGALVPGARAPIVVTEEHVRGMRPGSVIVDLAIDQGGCIATARPTSLSDPVYVEHGVVHYCVTNVPGQYPRTASRALSAAVAPRLRRLARDPRGSEDDAELAQALNVAGGRIVHPTVRAALEGAAGEGAG